MFFLFLQQHTNSIFAVQIGKYIPYIKNLVIPTILLCVYSLLKYTIAVGRKNVSWNELFVELPIDILCVTSTLIITFYIFSIGKEFAIIIGVVLLLISLLLAIGACYMRRYISECRGARSQDGHPIMAGVILYIFVLLWIFFISFCSIVMR